MEFELQSLYHILFRINTFRKDMKPFNPSSYGLNSITVDGVDIPKKPRRLIYHQTKNYSVISMSMKCSWFHTNLHHNKQIRCGGCLTVQISSPTIWGGGPPRGVMVKAMVCGIVVREFELQSLYYVHFRANTLGKGMNPLILPAMGWIVPQLFF